MMLAGIVMGVIESGAEELMGNLRESLVQAILGDIDGSLSILLTGMRLNPPPRAQAASASARQPVSVESRLEGIRAMIKLASG
jgi:hypothetical protein